MSQTIETGRFGRLNLELGERITVPQGLLGFPDYKEYCIVDPMDDTLILWLQSLDNSEVAFPILEPRIFHEKYTVTLSATDRRELGLEGLKQAAVFSVLTIPENIQDMTANLKAPMVVNMKNQVAKQVVLQETEYGIQYPMFRELRAHLLTIQAQKARSVRNQTSNIDSAPSVLTVKDLPPTEALRTLG